MPLYMLDTHTSSYIMNRSHPAVLKRLRGMPTRDVCISVITLAELMDGVAVSPRAAKDQGALDGFLKLVQVLPLAESSAIHYGAIRGFLKTSGIMIVGNDLVGRRACTERRCNARHEQRTRVLPCA